MAAPPPRRRPQEIYKREFLNHILEEAPESLLDVGCGDGALIKAVAEAGKIRVAGVEPGPRRQEAELLGLDVQSAKAEALPFDDGSFDMVTFQYVTHHLTGMRESLNEALRVARRAVLVLEGWYDERIASQRVARDFDEWAKSIDRAGGMIHNSCPKPDELFDIFHDAGMSEVDYACRLVLSQLPLDEVETGARTHMKDMTAGPAAAVELGRILAEARIHGMSDDGALFMRVRLPG